MSESAQTLICEDREYQLDGDGYLLDVNSWSRDFAVNVAAREGIVLEDDHWQIINMVREYFFRYDDSPPMRALVKLVGQQLGSEKANSRYLYKLFPDGPGKQASLLAGLPKPVSCI